MQIPQLLISNQAIHLCFSLQSSNHRSIQKMRDIGFWSSKTFVAIPQSVLMKIPCWLIPEAVSHLWLPLKSSNSQFIENHKRYGMFKLFEGSWKCEVMEGSVSELSISNLSTCCERLTFTKIEEFSIWMKRSHQIAAYQDFIEKFSLVHRFGNVKEDIEIGFNKKEKYHIITREEKGVQRHKSHDTWNQISVFK